MTETEVRVRLRNCDTDEDLIAELMEIVKDLAGKIENVERLAQNTAQYVDETIESGGLNEDRTD